MNRCLIAILFTLALAGPVFAYTLTVTAVNGSVQADPDEEDYDSGTVVTLVPIPDAGYCFSSWSGAATGKRLVATVTMTSNKSITANFKTWVAPIGIPTPSFGITESYRMYDIPGNRNGDLTYNASPDAGYYTHYVDSTDLNSTDTSNDYGSPSKPRLNIPATLPEGSVVEIHNSISGTSTRYVTANGTAAMPVFIRGVGSPAITGGILVKGSYSVWEGMTLYLGSFSVRVHDGSSAHHIAVRNNVVYGDGTIGGEASIGSWGSAGNVFHDIVIYGNHIHHGGDSESDVENDCHGIGIGEYVEDFWIVDNHIHHMGGDSVQVAHGAGFTTHEVYIGRNVMHDDRENAVDIKESNHVVVSQNEAWGYEPCSSAPGEVFVVHYDPQNIYWLYNTIYEGTYGIASSGCSYQYIIGNLILNMNGGDDYSYPYSPFREGIGVQWYNTDYTYVVNNTIVGCEMGIGSDLGSIATTIVNNIIADVNATDGYHVSIQGSGRTSSVISHNLFHQEGDDVQIFWNETYDGLTAFQNGTGKGENCLETDPLFVAANPYAFALTGVSPAVGAGVVSSVYADYETAYSLGICYDLTGGVRPQGAAWDIGAYEYEVQSTPVKFFRATKTIN